MSKARVMIEFETEGMTKHEMDNIIAGALCDAGVKGVSVVGPYLSEEGSPITSDFFVSDENFAITAAQTLRNAGIHETEIEEFVNGEKVVELHRLWHDTIQGNVNANMEGRKIFKELALKVAGIAA